MISNFPVNTAVCPDPGEPSKGKRLDSNFQEGKTVTFECNKNHDLVGNDKIRCKGGAWSGDVPKCKGDNNLTPSFTSAITRKLVFICTLRL